MQDHSPPTTGAAVRAETSAPTPASHSSGSNPRPVVATVIISGRTRALAPSTTAASLSAPKGDLDKNMHKALKVAEHADITFRLVRFESAAAGPRAIGLLKIAGVEKEVALDITTKRAGAGLAVAGRIDLLMTDYGIAPPKAMLGMLKTDPKVTITFETVLAIPLT